MTYAEMYEWFDEQDFWEFGEDGFYDLGEIYESAQESWEGRGNLEDIISYEEFINHYSEGQV